jgi:hypothetical protein
VVPVVPSSGATTLLAGLSYTVLIKRHRLSLHHSEFARRCTATIRVKLPKIDAVVTPNTPRMRMLLPS